MNWWHYLLLVNIYLVLFYSFYALLLRKETFFQLNRVYLVAAALLSFLIPLIQSESVQHLAITEQVRYSLYGGEAVNIYTYKPIESSPITIGQVLTFLYLVGIAFLTIRFILQLIRVNKIINAPAPSSVAYSFFNKISMGESVVKQDVVMAHEQVHARQWHSVDVMLIEAVMIINWFNPVVYLYRFAVKHIHEFIADQQALKVGADKAEYALLLLSQTFSAPSHQLVNPFYNHSLLKQRIIMIQKNKSHRVVLFKYVLSAPLFGLMLILSSATINNSKTINTIHNEAGNVFSSAITDIASANDYQQQENPNKVYEAVDHVPEFIGGPSAFGSYLVKTIKYPADARKDKIEGKVYVTFIVERDGSLTDVKVLRGPGHGLNEEALRVIKSSPKWKPGTQDGKKVRIAYTIPVNFTLQKKSSVVDEHAVPKENPPPAPTKKSRVQSVVLGPVGNAPTNSAQLQHDNANIVYEAVEHEPEFPGGPDAFGKFLAKTIKYPAVDRNNNVSGKVYISFVVEMDGSLTDIQAIRGPSESLKQEAVRALKASPKWKPGIQNGQAVRVQYTEPVNFTLSNDM
jgi:TonB family protein